MAWYGVAAGVGSIAGQVLGGLLITADVAGLGWRLIFLVNVPVGLVGCLLAARMLPARTRGPRARLDPVGAAGAALALALLLGLIFNCALALAIDLISDRVGDADEFEKLTGVPVIASIPPLKFADSEPAQSHALEETEANEPARPRAVGRAFNG